MRRLAFLLFMASLPVNAADLEGTVTRKGLGRKILVTLSSEDKTFALCTSAISKSIAKLARMKVRARGAWDAEAKCYAVKDFDVLELVNGARAVSGLFVLQGRQYVIKSQKEVYPIAFPTKGLLDMLNKKVITELNAATNRQGNLTYRIGSYMEWPDI